MPCVSVWLPFRDAAATIGGAIESIRAQSFTDWDLLAVDDGSSDDGPAIVRAHATQDPRIRLLACHGAGIVAALRTAAAASDAPYFARMDADDVAHPERLLRQLALLGAQPHLALCGTGVAVTGEAAGEGRRRYAQWLNSLHTPERIAHAVFIECPIAHPTFLGGRSSYDAIGGYRDGDFPEDYDLVLRLHAAGHALANVPEVLLDWRDTPQRLSRCDARYSLDAFRRLKHAHIDSGFLRGRRFWQWGAGEEGKAWLRLWAPLRRPEAVVEIDPGKIGQTIHGVPVVPRDALPPPGAKALVIAVGVPSARNIIRAWLGPRGYAEGGDYVFLA